MRLPAWMGSARVVAGLLLAGAMALLAVFGPMLAPHDPAAQDLSYVLQPVRLRGAYPLGTDALGRSGVTGEVDTHFAARFGAAILISLIDAGTAALVASQSNGDGSVVIAPQGASDVVAEVLRQTADVRPTIRVAQGGRMQVLVARDVSFAEVYALVRR